MFPVEWSSCFDREILILPTTSPCTRLSPAPSTFGWSDSHSRILPPSLYGLRLPYGSCRRLRVSRVHARSFAYMLQVYTPEIPPGSRLVDPAGVAFPFSREGRQSRKMGISRLFSFHLLLRPACCPVYALRILFLMVFRGVSTRFSPPFFHQSAIRTKLGSWLLARLCQGVHLRKLDLARLTARLPFPKAL